MWSWLRVIAAVATWIFELLTELLGPNLETA